MVLRGGAFDLLLYWWQFRGSIAVERAEPDTNWRVLLDLILNEIQIANPKFKMKLNGI